MYWFKIICLVFVLDKMQEELHMMADRSGVQIRQWTLFDTPNIQIYHMYY